MADSVPCFKILLNGVKPDEVTITPQADGVAITFGCAGIGRMSDGGKMPGTEGLEPLIAADPLFAHLWDVYETRRPSWRSTIDEEANRNIVGQLISVAIRRSNGEACRMLAYNIELCRHVCFMTPPENWEIPESLKPTAE